MTPMTDQILVDLQSIPSETKGGVLLPTAFEDDDEFEQLLSPEVRAGVVVAIGPGAWKKDGEARSPMPDVKVGQKIIVSPTAGIRLQQEGKTVRESTMFLFEARDIWAVCA